LYHLTRHDILDLKRYTMNGWEFLEEFQTRNLIFNISILSSSKDETDMQLENSYPFVSNYSYKPLNTEKLKKIFEAQNKT
jgi:two-component SAPR family response regulator